MDVIKELLSANYPFFYFFYGKFRGILHHYISNQEISISKISDNIYIGDIWAAYNKEELKSRGITHIVNAILGVEPAYPDEFEYFKIEAIDMQHQNLYEVFEKSNLWIDKALVDKGKVFIHCVCGVSRSATIACAYYIKKYGWEPNFTISYLQSKRDVIDPNPGFRTQLQNYYEKLYKPKDFETLV